MSHDESNIGVWLWLVLIVEINATWIGMDLWLRHQRHELLTQEFREGLRNELWGPFISGLVALTVVAFAVHMWNVRGR